MARNLSLILMVAALLLPCLLFSQSTHYENRLIEAIDVVFANEGEDSDYSSNQVLSRIKTAPGAFFSQTDFDIDLKTLAREYDHVEPMIELTDVGLRIVLKIRPKPVIKTIYWQGNSKISRATLQEELGISAGSLFDHSTFNQAFQKLKAYYVKKGYFEAELDYSIEADPCSNVIDITIYIQEGRSGRIKEIVFCGFDECEETALAALMITKKYNFFLSWFTGEGTYDEAAIQIDEYHILNYLQNEGFADATVDIEVCEAEECDRIIIYITADKGECYHFHSVTFEGNCILASEKIEDALTIESGDVYSADAIRGTISALQDAYGRCGYIDAIIDFESKLIECENAYSVHFTIEEGEPYRIGLIRIIGNTCTQNRVILHESLLVPGETFNIDKLKATEARLQNIEFFKHVNVYPAQPNELLGGGDCQYRDVNIEVEETGTGNFSAFGGYSSNESLFGGISITEKNFNHRGLFNFWQDGLHTLRGAGEFASLTANIGLKSSSYVLSWTEPHFRDTPWSVGFDAERSYNHIIAQDYEIRAVGCSVHATYPITPFFRFGWHYRLRNTNVVVFGNEPIQLEQTARNPGFISASGIHFSLDTTNSPVCPTQGIRSRLEFEYGGLGGDHHFFSMGYTNTYYRPICEKGVLKLRADMRYISPIGGTVPNTMPIDERIFLGGDNGVRGYRPYAIGPKFPGTTDPKGGMSMQLLSAEYVHKIFSRCDGFLFFDAGALSFQTWHVDRLRDSAGLGVRLRLLDSIPPVTLGLGFPINPANKSDVLRFFWALGGRF